MAVFADHAARNDITTLHAAKAIWMVEHLSGRYGTVINGLFALFADMSGYTMSSVAVLAVEIIIVYIIGLDVSFADCALQTIKMQQDTIAVIVLTFNCF